MTCVRHEVICRTHSLAVDITIRLRLVTSTSACVVALAADTQIRFVGEDMTNVWSLDRYGLNVDG
jgi:hypothetical protein